MSERDSNKFNNDKDYNPIESGFEQAKLFLLNDDVNTFDFIIESLVDICEHDEIQAEQLALIVHHKGKAVIKEGQRILLEAMKHKFNELKILVEVD